MSRSPPQKCLFYFYWTKESHMTILSWKEVKGKEILNGGWVNE